MRPIQALVPASTLIGSSLAIGCPYAGGLAARDEQASAGSISTEQFLAQFMVDDQGQMLTTDTGVPMSDQDSLRAGPRGSVLLEDFIFQNKLTHFDHERVPERVVHARGAGAYGTFTSNADWSNLTAASFLNAPGKQTPVFVRFSTVAGSRGSADTARDVHGFAVRLYTDEGNLDIVGNSIPVFFIQDAIQFPDLIHSVKPSPDNEMPQAATAHDSAWDFFSQQTSALHTLFWAMSGSGIPRSFRHMDGFGVNTFRMVTEDGRSKLIKWHWKTKQGKASLVWEEAQQLSGKNADFHRRDLWNAIAAGHGPEWDLAVQVADEEQVLAFGFDLLDPTKFIPEELVPLHVLGTMKLHLNPTNYFAETEQSMFQPGHIVRGIDFTEDPLLQGRIFSYLDTKLNRHRGPNFNQLPVNRARVPVHNNGRDGAGQNYIYKNLAHYTPNTISGGFPAQADQSRAFFTAPGRSVSGQLVRARSNTFDDHFTQPRLFFNSLKPVEQQFVVNAMRFELSKIQSVQIRQNVINALNRVSNELATRVAQALNIQAPQPDPTFYHNNVTSGLNIFDTKLPTIAFLQVGLLASVNTPESVVTATAFKDRLANEGVVATVIAESLVDGADQTYSASDATIYDGLIVAGDIPDLLDPNLQSTLFPTGRPSQLMLDAFRWGKPVGFFGSTTNPSIMPSDGAPGVYTGTDMEAFVTAFEDGLSTFRFTDRFPLDGATTAPTPRSIYSSGIHSSSIP